MVILLCTAAGCIKFGAMELGSGQGGQAGPGSAGSGSGGSSAAVRPGDPDQEVMVAVDMAVVKDPAVAEAGVVVAVCLRMEGGLQLPDAAN